MNAIMDDITLTMRRHSLYEVNEIMNTNFNGGDDFYFIHGNELRLNDNCNFCNA